MFALCFEPQISKVGVRNGSRRGLSGKINPELHVTGAFTPSIQAGYQYECRIGLLWNIPFLGDMQKYPLKQFPFILHQKILYAFLLIILTGDYYLLCSLKDRHLHHPGVSVPVTFDYLFGEHVQLEILRLGLVLGDVIEWDFDLLFSRLHNGLIR